MNDRSETQSKRIAKLEEQLRNYSSYTNNLKQSFKRDYNEMKIEIAEKDFELKTLKQQLKEQNEVLIKQTKEIASLTKSLKLLCGEDLEIQ